MPEESKLGPDDFARSLEAAPEDPRALAARKELERWQEFATDPWVKPETVGDAVRQAGERRTIWLLEAIDMMAFGAGTPSQSAVEAGARRLQACRALCLAAADGTFRLVGMLGENSERVETIARAYFDAEYRIGQGGNVLELDASRVPLRDDAKFDRLHLAKWFDVRIGDKEAFLTWLLGKEQAKIPDFAELPPQTPVVTDGRGAVTRAIQEAFKLKFPNGLPAGTSSQHRNDEIQKAVQAGLGRTVDKRTIQRALKKIKTG